MKVSILFGDITKLNVDVIVNAANKSLMGGGGVDGAIHRAAGKELLAECIKIRKESYLQGLPVGKAVVTKAYNLPAKWIIHTVGPVYGVHHIDLLEDCYQNSINLAEELKAQSICFPAVGTGAHRVPIEISANIVKKVLAQIKTTHLQEIILIFNKKEDYEIYTAILK